MLGGLLRGMVIITEGSPPLALVSRGPLKLKVDPAVLREPEHRPVGLTVRVRLPPILALTVGLRAILAM
jgi:hypothetical protein